MKIPFSRYLESDIQDLTGQVHVITGASSGIGFYCAKQLAYRGASIVMAVRDIAKGEGAKASILIAVPNARIDVLHYDQSSFRSIDDFLSNLKRLYPRIDALLLNAGLFVTDPKRLTVDRLPMTSGVNYFGPYYLLRQGMRYFDSTSSKPTRIVFVGSNAAHRVRLKRASQLLETQGNTFKAYAQSKLALSMLFHTLQMHLNLFDFPDRRNIAWYLVNPGVTATNIMRDLPKLLRGIFHVIFKLLFHSAEHAALTLTHAMGHRYAVNGSYFAPNGFLHLSGKPKAIAIPNHFIQGSAQFVYESGKIIKNLEGKS